MAEIVVSAETERFWLALDTARKQLSAERVEPVVAQLWSAIGPMRTEIPSALAVVLVACANFAADALMALEAGQLIVDPKRDDRVQAVPLFFRQMVEACVNDRRARGLLVKAMGTA